jgi:predicted nucleotidyltransferase
MHTRLTFAAKALERLCQRHQIRTLSLFGSRLKGTARPDSDVDLLVEFLPDRNLMAHRRSDS